MDLGSFAWFNPTHRPTSLPLSRRGHNRIDSFCFSYHSGTQSPPHRRTRHQMTLPFSQLASRQPRLRSSTPSNSGCSPCQSHQSFRTARRTFDTVILHRCPRARILRPHSHRRLSSLLPICPTTHKLRAKDLLTTDRGPSSERTCSCFFFFSKGRDDVETIDNPTDNNLPFCSGSEEFSLLLVTTGLAFMNATCFYSVFFLSP